MVEGWIPGCALERAVALTKAGDYQEFQKCRIENCKSN